MDRLYIQPLTLVPSPQAVAGDAIRLAGGMAYAHLFAATLTRDGEVVQRELSTDSAGSTFVARRCPPRARPWAEAQWAGLPPRIRRSSSASARSARPAASHGILNVTPDSFSDGASSSTIPRWPRRMPRRWLEAGAAIVDIRREHPPGAAAVCEGDEIKRVIPAVEHCVAMAPRSASTPRPAVMESALAAART